jgi:hypothetical protein
MVRFARGCAGEHIDIQVWLQREDGHQLLVVNGHTTAGAKSLPSGSDRVKLFKRTCLYVILDDALASTQGRATTTGRATSFVMGGDWNLTTKDMVEALNNYEAKQNLENDVLSLCGDSLHLLTGHRTKAYEGVTMRGPDNAHEVLVAKVLWPGLNLKDVGW